MSSSAFEILASAIKRPRDTAFQSEKNSCLIVYSNCMDIFRLKIAIPSSAKEESIFVEKVKIRLTLSYSKLFETPIFATEQISTKDSSN